MDGSHKTPRSHSVSVRQWPQCSVCGHRLYLNKRRDQLELRTVGTVAVLLFKRRLRSMQQVVQIGTSIFDAAAELLVDEIRHFMLDIGLVADQLKPRVVETADFEQI